MTLSEQGLWAVLDTEFRRRFIVRVSHARSNMRFEFRFSSVTRLSKWSPASTCRVPPGLVPDCFCRIAGCGFCIMTLSLVRIAPLPRGVTIGFSGRGEWRGVPRIGDRVYVGPNAVIVGKITIGNDVLVGANSLVNRDVPGYATVLGVPAVVTSGRGSEGYWE